jgi:uncharacterized protein YebE (UPF0316 family)
MPDTWIAPWLLVVLIFLARVADVSIGTVRTILLFRGYRFLAAGLGFFEILIWLLAAGQVLQDLTAWPRAVAYAAGFAVGNIVGMGLEAWLAMGLQLLRVVSANPEVRLARRLRGLGHSVVAVEGRLEEDMPVEILFLVEKRRRFPSMLRSILDLDPSAVCTTTDVRVPNLAPVMRPRGGFLSTGWRARSKRK